MSTVVPTTMYEAVLDRNYRSRVILKEQDVHRVLNYVHKHRSVTRRELSEQLRMDTVELNDLIRVLMEEHILAGNREPNGTVGRPPEVIRISRVFPVDNIFGWKPA